MDWVVGNLEYALEKWNYYLSQIWTLLTQSPEEFRDGAIWTVIQDIYGTLQAIGLALLVLFFVVGVLKTCGSFTELKRPEHALKLFIRFAIAKAVVTYGMEVMTALFTIVQGIISSIMGATTFGSTEVTLPDEIITAIQSCTFAQRIGMWAISLIGCLLILVLSFIVILTVYGRFFKIFIYAAIAPIPLAAFAGEPTQNIGWSFLKSYAAVCLEGAVIILACVIFSAFASTSPAVDTSAEPVTMVLSYITELIFNMLILVGTVRMSGRIVHEMMGL